MKRNVLFSLLALLIIASTILTACGPNPSPAFCVYIVGNGVYDRDIDNIIYPGQSMPDITSGHEAQYIPCNSRNYIINDGTRRNGENVIGDTTTQSRAITASGTPILVSSTAYWTVNQDYEAMLLFHNVLEKHVAWSSSDVAGDVNNSTPGWNDMLGENFYPAMETAIQLGAYQIDDSILTDPNKKIELANYMSASFADIVRMPTGYAKDIFCGSGDSIWADQNNRGPNGSFYCSPVHFVVTDVTVDVARQATNDSNYLDQQRLERAIMLYGAENAACWLAIQDTVATCGDNSTCFFSLSGVCNSGGGSTDLIIPTVPEP